jgi:hypothetical protein
VTKNWSRFPLAEPEGEDLANFSAYEVYEKLAIAGYGVLSGCVTTRTSATEVAVASGDISISGVSEPFAGGSLTSIAAAAAGKQRYDLVYIDGTDSILKLCAGVEETPDSAIDFLENYHPRPAEPTDTDWVILAIIRVTESGITEDDFGTLPYATDSIADMRMSPPFAVDNETLQVVDGVASTINRTWTPETNFTATPASTSTLTMTSDRTSVIQSGYGLKYTIGGTDYYGIVDSITSNLLTVAGVSLSGDVTSLKWCDPTRVVQVDFPLISGTFADAANSTLLSSDAKTAYRWNRSAAYCVKILHKVETKDSGASQPNVTIENKSLETRWTEVAPKYGSETAIRSLAVMDGVLYGGTYPNGNLLAWNGTDAWTEAAPQSGSETYIYSLAVMSGVLYGGTGPNGKLLAWNGIDAWTEVAPKYGSENSIHSLAVMGGVLYGGTGLHGNLLAWNGTDAWTGVAPQFGSEAYIYSLAVMGGVLYGGTSPNGKLLAWNGTDAWTEVAPKYGSETAIRSLAVMDGVLYGGTSPNGKLLAWNGVDAWTEVAPQYGSETDIYSLAVMDGVLYGGTGPNGKLLAWNGIDAWTEVAPRYLPEVYIYSLSVMDGVLYGGTANGGKLLYGVNGSILKDNGNCGLGVDTAWTSTTVGIRSSAYEIETGTSLEIKTDALGSNGDASDLTVSAMFVIP